ncbi:MAG: hypothetical protein IKF99_10995 [Oscillospiraceae bacterium]|nr:hypothetical protein [Oscillospiraceae bacterium]
MTYVSMRYGSKRKKKTVASSGGGGSAVTYTRLWTNGSPSSSFAAQDVTLSAAASGYGFIRVVWARINTAGVTADNWEASTDALAVWYDMRHASSLLDSTNTLQMGMSVRPGTGYYSRRLRFSSAACTVVRFGETTRWSTSGTNNALLIPVLIDGVTIS